jgi:hypothetical protein
LWTAAAPEFGYIPDAEATTSADWDSPGPFDESC